MNRFFKWLVPKVERWCERTGRVMHITGKQGPEDVYLIRYFVFRSWPLSVYIHRFLRSDIDDPHDHPFDFLGYVVSGQYKETLYRRTWSEDVEQLLDEGEGVRDTGTWAFRVAETIHKVEVDKNRTLAERFEAPLTFIFRGPYRREWNFWRIRKGATWDNSSTYDGMWIGKPEVWYNYLGCKPSSRE